MDIPFQNQILQDDLEDSSREAEFLRRLVGSYRDLYIYVLSIVGNRTDADDVTQEVCAVLWEKFDEFDPDRNFRKWASGFAFNVAKSFMRQQRRRRGFGLSDEILARIAFVQTAGTELFELRRERLHDCLTKLGKRDSRFLMDCYGNRTTLVRYARSHGIPVASVYTRLKRLRKNLVECVHRSLRRHDET